jgi:hypothetical protein
MKPERDERKDVCMTCGPMKSVLRGITQDLPVSEYVRVQTSTIFLFFAFLYITIHSPWEKKLKYNKLQSSQLILPVRHPTDMDTVKNPVH